MISSIELERAKEKVAEYGLYTIHLALALSLICSLAIIAIISKKHFANNLWLDVAVFVVPMPIAIYFKRRIVIFGGLTYVAVLILLLVAAVLFGI